MAWILSMVLAASAVSPGPLQCFPDRDAVRVSPIAQPDARLAGRGAAFGVWTGSQLLLWATVESSLQEPESTERLLTYEPASDRWTQLPLHTRSNLRGATLVFAAGRAILWGGVNDAASRITNEGLIFDPATGALEKTSLVNAPSPRHFHSAVAVGGKMFVFGGGGAGRAAGWSCDGALFDPIANAWSPVAPPPQSVCTSIALIRLLAAGEGKVAMLIPASPPASQIRAAVYDVAQRRWSVGPELDAGALSFQTAPVFGPDGALYAVAAENSVRRRTVLFRIDPTTLRFAEAGDLPEPGLLLRSGARLVVVGAIATEIDVRDGRCTLPMRATGLLGPSARQAVVATDDGFLLYGHGRGTVVRFPARASPPAQPRENVRGAALLGARGWCGGATPPPWSPTPAETPLRDTTLLIRRGLRNVDPRIAARVKTDADGLFEARLGRGDYCVVDQTRRSVRIPLPKGADRSLRACLREENARCLATFSVAAAGVAVPVIVHLPQSCYGPCFRGPPRP